MKSVKQLLAAAEKPSIRSEKLHPFTGEKWK